MTYDDINEKLIEADARNKFVYITTTYHYSGNFYGKILTIKSNRVYLHEARRDGLIVEVLFDYIKDIDVRDDRC